MARNSQKIIQLLRSSQIYTPTIEEGVQTKSALQNAMESFNAAFVAAAEPKDGEIMLARYQETGEDVKAVLAAYTNKSNETGFTFYLDSVAISEMLDELSEKIDIIEVKNSIESSDASITVTEGDSTTPTDVVVNVDNVTIVKDSTTGALKGNYELHMLNSTELEALQDNNVREAYQLQTVGSTTAIGNVVKIYKDSALIEIYLGSGYDTVNTTTGAITKYAWQSKNDPSNRITDEAYQALDETSKANYEALDFQNLNYVYQLADGTYSLVSIDISKFLAETEFGAGLKVVNGIVSLDVRGTVTVGEDVTYVAINTTDETDKLTSDEYNGLSTEQKNGYYTYVNVNDQTDMLTEAGYNNASPDVQANYTPISIQDTIPVQTNVFNENNGIVDVNAIQDAIDYASISAAEGVRVNGSDSIRVDGGNTVYVRLSSETDNVLGIETGATKGLYLSGTWDCGEY